MVQYNIVPYAIILKVIATINLAIKLEIKYSNRIGAVATIYLTQFGQASPPHESEIIM